MSWHPQEDVTRLAAIIAPAVRATEGLAILDDESPFLFDEIAESILDAIADGRLTDAVTRALGGAR